MRGIVSAGLRSTGAAAVLHRPVREEKSLGPAAPTVGRQLGNAPSHFESRQLVEVTVIMRDIKPVKLRTREDEQVRQGDSKACGAPTTFHTYIFPGSVDTCFFNINEKGDLVGRYIANGVHHGLYIDRLGWRPPGQ